MPGFRLPLPDVSVGEPFPSINPERGGSPTTWQGRRAFPESGPFPRRNQVPANRPGLGRKLPSDHAPVLRCNAGMNKNETMVPLAGPDTGPRRRNSSQGCGPRRRDHGGRIRRARRTAALREGIRCSSGSRRDDPCCASSERCPARLAESRETCCVPDDRTGAAHGIFRRQPASTFFMLSAPVGPGNEVVGVRPDDARRFARLPLDVLAAVDICGDRVPLPREPITNVSAIAGRGAEQAPELVCTLAETRTPLPPISWMSALFTRFPC